MSTDYIPWGLLLLAGAKLLSYITDLITQPEKAVEHTETDNNKKQIQYLVNGNPINKPHHVYYLQILGLLGKRYITDTNIKQATKNNFEIARDMETGSCTIADHIIAARYFLLDQWTYCSSKN